MTEEHLFYVVGSQSRVVGGEQQTTNDLRQTSVDGVWVPAKELSVGDFLLTSDAKKAVITKITEVVLDEPISVYNLEATPFNDYVMEGGVVVHNSNKRFLCYNCGKARFCPYENLNTGECGGIPAGHPVIEKGPGRFVFDNFNDPQTGAHGHLEAGITIFDINRLYQYLDAKYGKICK